MPRPRIDLGQGHHGRLTAAPATRTSSAGASGGRLLEQPRSRRYLDAVSRLDGSATLTPVETADIIDAVHEEFSRGWSTLPIRIVSHCFLGPPFEAHTLGLEGSIIEHFRVGESLPGQLQEARPLTRSDTYLCIEVYPDRLVCVRADGTITVMGAS